MNFVDYCIATKNYSALNAVNEYSKLFSATKHTNPELTNKEVRDKLANDLKDNRKLKGLLGDDKVHEISNDIARKLAKMEQNGYNKFGKNWVKRMK